MDVVIPMTLTLIFLILFALYQNLKFPLDHRVQRPRDRARRRPARAGADRDATSASRRAWASWR